MNGCAKHKQTTIDACCYGVLDQHQHHAIYNSLNGAEYENSLCANTLKLVMAQLARAGAP